MIKKNASRLKGKNNFDAKINGIESPFLFLSKEANTDAVTPPIFLSR